MLLAIDTCGNTGTLALARLDGETLVLLGEADLAGKTYSAMLTPQLGELLATRKVSLQQLEAIVIVNGPGSFTGVRVGVSTVKGIIEALGIPVIAVSRLAVLVQKAQARCAAIDAGRGEFYFGDFEDGVRELLLSAEEVQSATRAAELGIYEEKVGLTFPQARMVSAPTAADALNFALPRLLARDFDDPVLLDGNYLRRADAEVKMDALKA